MVKDVDVLYNIYTRKACMKKIMCNTWQSTLDADSALQMKP